MLPLMSEEMSACPAAWDSLAQPDLNITWTQKIKSPVNKLGIAQGPQPVHVSVRGIGYPSFPSNQTNSAHGCNIGFFLI